MPEVIGLNIQKNSEVTVLQLGFVNNLRDIEELSEEARKELEKVTNVFPFHTNKYYLSLINWEDPNDPLKKMIIPSADELINGGSLDPSNEASYTKQGGIEHKYSPTALILASNTCASLCRFCFRKRLFMKNNEHASPDMEEAFHYIENHKEINNVLVTGGDPLILSTPAIEKILKRLLEIDHLRLIRIGTKIPVTNPYRFINDESLTGMMSRLDLKGKSLAIVTDINHPREINETAIQALNMMKRSGVQLYNQTPLLKGVNDDPEVLVELMNSLISLGISPYYIFQCRPTKGNAAFAVPVEESYAIVEKTKSKLSGMAKRSRLIMSHKTGKIEVVALLKDNIVFKYHNAALLENQGKVMIYKRNPEAVWFDDYTELIDEYTVD